jgi:hypothetical protein
MRNKNQLARKKVLLGNRLSRFARPEARGGRFFNGEDSA